jgi:hypothetical protein
MAYTLAATGLVVIADLPLAALQVTLPTAVGIAGLQYTIKRTNAAATT